uniref:RdRp n=1 Tax=Hubei partiti-like virus 38 TaxID=1923045 RepID=A0A1L3KLH6_9VIRU|nr:RdRp [Hubei partiti-like virus 38]
MSFIGKSKGFGQRFTPPAITPYLQVLAPHAGEYVRSNVSLSLIREDVKRFKPHGTEPVNDPYMKIAIAKATNAFRLPQPVKLLHLNDVFKRDLPIWSSSPGLPWNQQGYKTKGEIRDDPDAIKRVRWFWHRVKEGKSVYRTDCCAFVRAQLAKVGEFKCRAVWGYPATMVFGEAVFALPLIDAYSKISSPIAYGYETGTGGMHKLYHEIKGAHYLGIDYKNFDKTVPEWIIRVAFDILFLNLDMLGYKDYGVTRVDCIMRMWNYVIDYFINTPIRLCNGERYQKRGAIASGSYFTQLIGSIVNYILMTYVSLREDNRILHIKVLGDDSVTAFSRPIYPSDVAKYVEPLGFTINTTKSGSSKYLSDLSFLGHQINCGYPLKPRSKVIAGLLYPERPDSCWDDVASRALGILYSNLGVDEHVDFWCRRVVKFRPFDLALTRNQEKLMRVLKIPIPDVTEPPDLLAFHRRLMGAS